MVSPRSSKYVVISGCEQQSVIDEAINRRGTFFVCTGGTGQKKAKKKKRSVAAKNSNIQLVISGSRLGGRQ